MTKQRSPRWPLWKMKAWTPLSWWPADGSELAERGQRKQPSHSMGCAAVSAASQSRSLGHKQTFKSPVDYNYFSLSSLSFFLCSLHLTPSHFLVLSSCHIACSLPCFWDIGAWEDLYLTRHGKQPLYNLDGSGQKQPVDSAAIGRNTQQHSRKSCPSSSATKSQWGLLYS